MSPESAVATAAVNASIRPASPPPWPSAAVNPRAREGVITRSDLVRKSCTRIVSPSPVSSARVPKIRVCLPPPSLNAVMVNVAVVPPGYSSATT